MKIAATGFKPNMLFGYDLTDPNYAKMREMFKLILVLTGCKEAISGLALGTEMIFAQAVLELKEMGYDIRLVCAAPYLNFTERWHQKEKEEYERIKGLSDEFIIITEKEYCEGINSIADKWTAEHCDLAIGVYKTVNDTIKKYLSAFTKADKKVMVLNADEIKESIKTAEDIRANYEVLFQEDKVALTKEIL